MAKKTDTASIEKLTMGEISTVEDISGMSIDSLGNPGTPKARLLIALATVIHRRTNPKFSVSDAEALSFNEITDLVGLAPDED